jgi:hypothetical protein
MTVAGPDPWDVPDLLSPDCVPAWAAQPTGGTTTMSRAIKLTAWCPRCQRNVPPARWCRETFWCDSCTDALHRTARQWSSTQRWPVRASAPRTAVRDVA